MANTTDVGRLFFHRLRYPDNSPVPLIAERGRTQEMERPWRSGHSFVIRLPLTRSALVVGRWSKRGAPSQADADARLIPHGFPATEAMFDAWRDEAEDTAHLTDWEVVEWD